MEKLYTKPIIVIGSNSNTKPKSLIKLLTGENVQHEDETVVIQPSWKIDTKYYTTEVDVYGISSDYCRSDKFNSSVEALLIHMDSNKQSGLEDLEKWLLILEDCDPEIKLLLCNYCTSDTKITRPKALEWCLKRGFELIELYPNIPNKEQSDEDNDELIEEKFGIDRVIEALQTHVWSNLVMKNKSESGSGYTEVDVDISLNTLNSCSKAGESNIVDESMLTTLVANDGIDDFNELFSQLHLIKDSMKSMPASQRKQCAEHMVTAFWHAIGGDEEELADL